VDPKELRVKPVHKELRVTLVYKELMVKPVLKVTLEHRELQDLMLFLLFK
jgi:hypothetical protein